MITEKKVAEMIEAAIVRYNTAAQQAFTHKADKWEIGKRVYWRSPSSDVVPPPKLICRVKRSSESLHHYSLGYYDEVIEITLEDLLDAILTHCGIEVKIKKAAPASWEITRK